MDQDETLLTDTVEEGLEMAKNKDYAFIWNTDAVYALTKDNCDYLAIPQDIMTGYSVIAWNKHLPYKRLFNHYINKLKQSGLMNRILQKHVPKPRSDCGSADAFRGISLNKAFTLFLMLALGGLLAILILVLEIFIDYSKKQQQHGRVFVKIHQIFH